MMIFGKNWTVSQVFFTLAYAIGAFDTYLYTNYVVKKMAERTATVLTSKEREALKARRGPKLKKRR